MSSHLSSSRQSKSASEVQEEAKNLLKDVVRAIGWTEQRSDGEYIISDNAGHPIDNIKTSYKSRKWGSITSPNRDGRAITLKVNTGWWNSRSPEERLGLIVHEVTHLKVHSRNGGSAHRPEFWELNIDIFRKLAKHPDFQEFDWGKVGDWAVNDPNHSCVDGRSESVEERKERMKVVRTFR